MGMISQRILYAAENQLARDEGNNLNRIYEVDITMIQGHLYYGTFEFENIETGSSWEADFTYNTHTTGIEIS